MAPKEDPRHYCGPPSLSLWPEQSSDDHEAQSTGLLSHFRASTRRFQSYFWRALTEMLMRLFFFLLFRSPSAIKELGLSSESLLDSPIESPSQSANSFQLSCLLPILDSLMNNRDVKCLWFASGNVGAFKLARKCQLAASLIRP